MSIMFLVSVVTTLSVFVSPRDAWEQEIQSQGFGARADTPYAVGVAPSVKRTKAVAKREARCAQAIAESAVLERNLTVPFNERVYRTEVGSCTPSAGNVVWTKTSVASGKPPYREKILTQLFDDQWRLLAVWRKALVAWNHRSDDAKQRI